MSGPDGGSASRGQPVDEATEARAAGRIAILMATFNGARFIDEQLASIAAQDWPLLDIWIGDDGSTDETPALLENWRRRWRKGKFTILAGPGRGFAENFRALLVRPDVQADYIAFSDQDDVWDPDKLSSAVARLRIFDPATPSLYGSRTRLIDAAGAPLGLSPLFRRPPAFANALVQSIAGGNTMVMNRPAFALLAESARRTGFVSHDWWSYLLVTGAGGAMVYDPVPHIGYRQHGSNLVGNNAGLRARAARLRRLWHGQLAAWMDANLTGLDHCRDLLAADSRRRLGRLHQARRGGLLHRIAALAQAGVYRQTLPQSLTLWLAAILARL